jgi:hypothetical protein
MAASKILEKEPNMVEGVGDDDSPVIVVGDLHG